MNYFLDTNIIIYFLKGTFDTICKKFKNIPPQSIYIPSIVIAEIEYGCKKSYNYQKSINEYYSFINVFKIKDFDIESAKVYGTIRRELECAGTIIGSNDMMIASIVIRNNGSPFVAI